MARGIKITWASSRYKFGQHDGVRVRFDVADACEMESKIFAFRARPLNPQTGEKAGYFSHVCSPPDLAEYPEDVPQEGQEPEWFRLNYVDVLIRSLLEAEDFVAAVRADVRRLKSTLDIMDTLVPGGTETLGELCPPSSSSTSDDSEPLDTSDSSSESFGPVETLAAIGTSEQSISSGVPWTDVGTGAGSSLESLPADYNQVRLAPGFTSQLLLIQGFDFSELPDDSRIVGLSLRLVLRHVESAPGDTYCPVVRYLSLHHPDQGVIENQGASQCVDGPDYVEILAGGEADLWHEIWTAKLLKRGELGVALIVGLGTDAVGLTDQATIQVDGAELTVHYRVA